jgi:predicted ATPase/serine phosphatase RsbU (regulator of sigma subunit)
MTKTIAGYHNLNTIHDGTKSLIYRGVRDADQRPVILKVLKDPFPTSTALNRYQQEFELLQRLYTAGITGVVQGYDLQKQGNGLMLVMEDIGGESLKSLMQNHQMSLMEFLRLAIKIVTTLGAIHHHHIIHKDVNPSNIVMNAETGIVQFIDFGLATALSREHPVLTSPNGLEGTLAYISPEQTGRTNRAVDARTDFYSLGVTFYELLTGRVPFDASDPMEVVHSHLAKQPVPLHEINAEIPLVLSQIILKLMAKNAEDRYQSAYGVQADLAQCLHQWETTGRITAFQLSQQDYTGQFRIPEQLYGRDEEMQALWQTFEWVQKGSQEIVVVTGPAGVGKSVLVEELRARILAENGYFLSGQYEQSPQTTPYSALMQAFSELVNLLLTEPAERIEQWKTEILAAVGVNGQILIEMIPSLALILGPQLPVPELGPTETQNRFQAMFQKFVNVLTHPDQPLVLFLDNVQWADTASLNLLRVLASDVHNPYLLVMLAYRENEMEASHPVWSILAELKQQNVIVHSVPVDNLSLDAVHDLIADTLQRNEPSTQALAEVVYDKTGGNALFVTQFLQSLYEEALLAFDSQRQHWYWNLEAIREKSITANMVELMTKRVSRLPSNTQAALKIAACRGEKITVATLAQACDKPVAEVVDDVQEAFHKGLLIQLDEGTIGFTHDRVREAAYALLSETEQPHIHYQLGQFLLAETPEAELAERVFDIVSQFNRATKVLSSQEEQVQVAHLNLIAGVRAKHSAAYEAAAQFLQQGLDLLPPDAWEESYELTLSLYIEGCEAAYLVGGYEDAEQRFAAVLAHAQTPLEKIHVYDAKMAFLEASHKYQEALRIGREGLQALGFTMPSKGTRTLVLKEVLVTKALLRNRTVKDLIHLPALTDPHYLAIARLLNACVAPSFIADPDYFAIVSLKLLRFSIQHGNSMYAAIAYATYGVMCIGVLGDRAGGYQFGRLALEVLEQFNARGLKARIYMIFGAFINHWQRPLKENLDYLLEAYRSGVETGDFTYGSYGLDNYIHYFPYTGAPLATVKTAWAQYEDGIKRLGQLNAIEAYEMLRQMLRCLSGEAENASLLKGELFDETVVIPKWRKDSVFTFLGQYTGLKLTLCYLSGAFEEALAVAQEGQTYLSNIMGMAAVVHYHFYYALTMLAHYPVVDARTQRHYLKQVRASHRKLKQWAQDAPENFAHLSLLVEAEQSRVQGKGLETTLALYEQAIALAREQGFLQDEALANELAGKFWLSHGNDKLADVYLQNAHYAYQRWGATTKVKALEDTYLQLVSSTSRSSGTECKMTTTTTIGHIPSSTSTNSTSLDLTTILKASQAISSEINLGKLLAKLMGIVIENAGAQRGCLVLAREGELLLEAEGSVSQEARVLQALPVTEASALLSLEIVRYVARTTEQVVLDNASRKGRFTRTPYVRAQQPKSVLCAPLLNQGELIGLIYLENNLSPGAFTPNRIKILNILASQAAISVENTKLIEHLGEQERLKQEMELANRIQTALLPDLTRSIHPDLEITAIMLPAEEVGGDFYDVALDREGTLWLGIGDVSGHGVTSGLIMMMAQTVHTTITRHGPANPRDVVIKTNDVLYKNVHERLGEDHFMTFTVLKYLGQGTFQHAGDHLWFVVYRQQQQTCERIPTNGAWLNMIPDISEATENEEFTLNIGDILVLYTDGLTEAFNRQNEMLDIQRFMELVSAHAEKEPVAMRDAILQDVLAWCDNTREDDMSLVIVQRIR